MSESPPSSAGLSNETGMTSALTPLSMSMPTSTSTSTSGGISASSMSTTNSVRQRLKQLRSSELLSLLLAPDLEESFTPGALVGADNQALFRLLPLILAAIHRMGQSRTRRDRFVELISILRLRIASCRSLKLRFLLLLRNPAFAQHWVVKLVHRRDCYLSARLLLSEMESDMKSLNKLDESLEMAQQLIMVERNGSRDAETSFNSHESLVRFALSKVLHKDSGIRTRKLTWRMKTVHNAFHAFELVDGIMERTSFASRKEAISVAQRMLDMGIILKVGSRSRKFVDEKKRIYQCGMALLRDDAGHCRLMTNEGKQICAWEMVKKDDFSKVSQIEIQLAVDMVDLQSYDFWTESIYVKGLEKGHRYGFRAVAHPLVCLNAASEQSMEHPQDGGDSGESSDPGVSTDTPTEESSLSLATLSMDEINLLSHDTSVIGSVEVVKVFSSIARPMIVQLRVPLDNSDLDSKDSYTPIKPGILVKEGDNLMQDLGVEIMFQCFNHVWANSSVYADKEGEVPFSVSYEVFPTSPTKGFMEAVTGLTSLKDYDWHMWRKKYGHKKERINEMLRSTAGAYVGTYVCGGRDRHFDNVLIKDDKHLLHIDFGFLMGTYPPIDGPRIAIAPSMEAVFRDLKVWNKFVHMFVDAFIALRRVAPAIIRTSVSVFSKAGYEEDQIRSFLMSRFSLNVHEKEEKAADFVRKQILQSSSDIKTKFKAFAHQHIDPAWYGLLEKGFPPAVAIMKLVDAKEQKAAKKLETAASGTLTVSADERIQL